MSETSTDPSALPVWDLNPIYRGFDDPGYMHDKNRLKESIEDLLQYVENGDEKESPGQWLWGYLEKYNYTADIQENLEAYAYTRFSTDTRDERASNELNTIETLSVPLQRIAVLFRNVLSRIKGKLPAILASNADLAPYEYFLRHELELQSRQLSPAEEDLAADLSRAGGEAWGRLQESVSSTLSMPWDEKTGERKTVIQLRALAFHPDREIRKKAYDLEIEAWKQAELPLAFALNGVKGFSDTLNSRRGFGSTLERSILQSRISGKTLDSLISSMEEALPQFRKYLAAKARLLGVPKLSFYDIFAPVTARAGSTSDKGEKTWDFREAADFILARFGEFSPELADFASSAFKHGWIDALPREGKVGGAYCIDFPLTGASRVLCNFDGSFSSLTTVAHELGHAYHHHVLKDAPHILGSYPMTLAETASIFSETIVFNGAIEASPDDEKITYLETFLSDSTQVIVDIYSRFLFENAVMKIRHDRELSPREFSDLMLDAQKKAYGDALLESELHPYMWAVKSHYYRQNLAFYNFPYAFGQLFGLGLYARFKREGGGFASVYRDLLRLTGRSSANDVTKSAGFDIETKDFWRSGIDTIREKIDGFVGLVEKTV